MKSWKWRRFVQDGLRGRWQENDARIALIFVPWSYITELRWLLLPNLRSRPDLASSDFHWFGLFTDPLRDRKFGCESELNEVIKGMSKRMVLD